MFAVRSGTPAVGEEVVEEGINFEVPAEGEVNEENEMPDPAPAVVDLDVENGEDEEKAQADARHIKIDFEPQDVLFWFSQLEAEMMMAQCIISANLIEIWQVKILVFPPSSWLLGAKASDAT